jgi:hypothetical protein
MAESFVSNALESLKAVKEAQQVKKHILETSAFLQISNIAHMEARDSTGGKFDIGQDALAVKYYLVTYQERLRYLISIYESNLDDFADKIDNMVKPKEKPIEEKKPEEKPAEELSADEGDYLDE